MKKICLYLDPKDKPWGYIRIEKAAFENLAEKKRRLAKEPSKARKAAEEARLGAK